MKQLVYTLLLITVIGCHAQNKPQNKMKELTLEELKRQGYKRKEQDTFMVKDGKLDIKLLKEIGTSVGAAVPTDEGWKRTRSYGYEKILEDGTQIAISGNELSGYRKSIIKKDSYLETYYVYYPSGNLEKTGMLYDNSKTLPLNWEVNSTIYIYSLLQKMMEKYCLHVMFLKN